MPERSGDFNGIWMYPTVYPGANMKLNPNAVKLEDGLVEALGLDGRFLGALRPFPGMADQTVHGVPKPEAGKTVTSITGIVFAKYVAIQKGLSNDLLKGILYIGMNPGGTGHAVYFAYRDTSDGSTDVRMLEDFNSWTDFKLNSVANDYDTTSLGKYAYLVASGETSSSVPTLQNKKAPYNKAYFWDFKVNAWDNFVVGFDNRFMSLLPERLLSVNLNDDGPALLNGDDVLDTAVIAGDGVGSGPLASDVYYTFAVQLVSKKHGLRSYLRWHTQKTLTAASDHSLRYAIAGVNPPLDFGAFVQQVRGNANERTHVLEWGMPHFDGFRLFRSPQDDLGLSVDQYAFAELHENDAYKEVGNFPTGSVAVSHNIDYRNVVPSAIKPTIYSETTGGSGVIVQQPQYDPYLDAFGPAPRLKRIQTYDGLLVAVADAEEPGAFNVTTKENEKSPEAIVWSTLTSPEPENFPAENYYRLDNPAERFLSLVTAGDHLFGITNSSIYRITRSGGSLAINKLVSSTGGVSRNGACGVGGSLFVTTPAGVKEIDGNTGEIRSLSIMDRIILDDSEWAGTLTNVFMEYDAKLGALIFLNTNKKECFILWEATGAVTKLTDVPWSFLTSGPDVLTDGPQRVFFITSAAAVHVIDGSRQMGKRSMCGTSISETVNGTVTTGSATNLIDTGATFPANCVGFKIYILSGTRSGESADITARNSATDLSITGLSGTLAVGDRYSVSPVVTRIVLPQLSGEGGAIDPFVRKTTTAMAVAFSDLTGDYAGVNGKVTMGVKQNFTTVGTKEVAIDLVPDQVVGYVNFASTRVFPFLEFKGGNLDFEVQAVLVKGMLGISEFQSRTGT